MHIDKIQPAVTVKWPNDLWLEDKKLSGLLIDLSSKENQIDWMIVSIGTNVNNPYPRMQKFHRSL